MKTKIFLYLALFCCLSFKTLGQQYTIKGVNKNISLVEGFTFKSYESIELEVENPRWKKKDELIFLFKDNDNGKYFIADSFYSNLEGYYWVRSTEEVISFEKNIFSPNIIKISSGPHLVFLNISSSEAKAVDEFGRVAGRAKGKIINIQDLVILEK